MIIIYILITIILMIFPYTRVIILNPIKTIKYTIKDIVKYIKNKLYNKPQMGELIAYVGLFGKGKTLNMVHDALCMYRRYNGKKIVQDNKVLTVRIMILSNVKLLGVDYVPLIGLQQIIDVAHSCKDYDKDNDTLTNILVLGDEFSVQLNSRQFKTNIDPLFLNTLLTCRHYNISIFYTSQRFGHVDALLRQVTSKVCECNHLWRIYSKSYYDAWTYENIIDKLMLKPLYISWYFCDDSNYKAYDTYATVDNLEKAVKQGDMLSGKEILDSIGGNDSVGQSTLSEKGRKKIKKA